MSLFDGPADASTCDADFLAYGDHVTKRAAREAIDAAWLRVQHLHADKTSFFIDQFRRDFRARAWELWLLDAFDAAGFPLTRASAEGPDVCINLTDGRRCWIEAIVPRLGDGDDAVSPRLGAAARVALYPEEQLLLRYAQAISDKAKKISSYIEKGIVGRSDVVFIALDGSAILDADLHDVDGPAALKVLFPIGETAFVFAPDEEGRIEVLPREAITKKKGGQVRTTMFCDSAFAHISGVIQGHSDWTSPRDTAATLDLIHNPHASVAAGLGLLPVRSERWLDGDQIRCKDRVHRER